MEREFDELSPEEQEYWYQEDDDNQEIQADECGDDACRKMAKYEQKYNGYCEPDSPCFIRR